MDISTKWSPDLVVVDVLAYAKRIAADEDAHSLIELGQDETISAQDKRDILALALYTIEYDLARRDRYSRRQRRAMALLRSFLNPSQREYLRRNGYCVVRGSLGNQYQLHPRTGQVWRVERRGSRWYSIASYCLHDYAEDDPAFVPRGLPREGARSVLPPADLSVSHLLLLLADEAEFRRAANERVRYSLAVRFVMQLRREREQLERKGPAAEAA